MIIVVLAALLVAIGSLVFIALPLVRPSRTELPRVDGASADLLSRRDRIYGELRELEFDARVGKVTGPDYAEARERLEFDAARVLRALDVEEPDVVEEEAEVKPATRSTCRACGAALPDGARFCSICGAPAIVEVHR